MDVIITGAGPVGCYTAAILGYAGIKVGVFEKRKKRDVKKEIGIIHFDVRCYKPLNLPRPLNNKDVYIGTFEKLWQVPLNEEDKFAVDYPTDILHMNEFINWIAKYAKESGNVEFHYETPFEAPIIEDKKVIGAKIGGNIGDVYANITIDCSGMHAVVRNSLPEKCNVSSLIPRNERTFTVYMEKWKCTGKFPQGSNTFVSYKGFANQVGSDLTLIGTSTLKGREYTRKMHKEMVERQKLNEITHTIVETLEGEVPYDFPPSSLVGDGFLSIGDAAFQNKPYNGEGIASGMEAANLALPIIVGALKKQDVSRENLWDYNVSFFRGFGADFVMIRGAGETLVELNSDEFNWMFENGFIDKSMLFSTFTTYKAGISTGLIKSAIKGFKNRTLFKKILRGIRLGMALSRLYKNYPKDPSKLPDWEKKWAKTCRACYQQD